MAHDNRVHMAWLPEPNLHNGLFYTSCVLCDGTDWRGRDDGSGNRFSKLSDDTIEFIDMCVTQTNVVHLIATSLDHSVPPFREQDDQMVHYMSLNNGANWEPNKTMIRKAFEDTAMTCVGEDAHALMRFKDMYYARWITDGTGGRSWVFQAGMPHAGPSLSEISMFVNKDSVLTGYTYTSWEYRDPLGVHYTSLVDRTTTTVSAEMNFRLRPNNTLGGENSRGQRVAIWADINQYLHLNTFDGTAWTGDQPFTDSITPLNATNGLARAACYNYSPGHGWQGRILWPVTAIGEYNGSFHVLFRAPTELTESGTTKTGVFHYIKFQPFDPTDDHPGVRG